MALCGLLFARDLGSRCEVVAYSHRLRDIPPPRAAKSAVGTRLPFDRCTSRDSPTREFQTKPLQDGRCSAFLDRFSLAAAIVRSTRLPTGARALFFVARVVYHAVVSSLDIERE